MKIRSGFVSNSSSASFIVKWRKRNASVDPEGNFMDLIDHDSFLSGFTEEIRDNSVLTDDGWIETSHFTSMMNDMGDFSEYIRNLLMYLAVNADFEYEARLED